MKQDKYTHKKPHILVIGAGFGGVYTARYLVHELHDEADITIISRDNYFLFTPLLHEVATGGLSNRSVTEPIAEIFRGTDVRFVQNEVHSLDFEGKTVETDMRAFSYDYLVVSSGAETNTYDIPGVAEFTLKLKTLPDAVALRKRIIESIKTASHTDDQNERKNLLSFIIVGAGPTGVELTIELAEFIFQVAKSYYASALSAHEISITLIASGNDLVPQFSPEVRAKALSVLREKGIEILLNTAVIRVSAIGVDMRDNSKIGAAKTRFLPAGTIVWVAGVEASLPEMKGKMRLHKNGRLMVNDFLQVEGYADCFALGDAAILPTRDGEPPIPQLAQSAVQEARIVAKNISVLIKGEQDRTTFPNLTSFTYKSKGMLISLGSWQAAGDMFGMHPSGRLMWFLWRTIYLFKFNSWRKRLSIVFEWTINIFTPRDISEI
jgi:NADH dehydrogenase